MYNIQANITINQRVVTVTASRTDEQTISPQEFLRAAKTGVIAKVKAPEDIALS